VDLVLSVVADEQPLEVVKPGEGAFDDPAHPAEPRAVFAIAARDHGCDPALADEAAVFVVVVASVGDELVGSAARTTGGAFDRRHPVEQRDQLGDVVAVATADRPGERDPGRVDQEVVFRAGSAPVNRARARFGAPFFACT
jgi:hypothetical protein